MRRYTNTPFSFVNLIFDLIEALLVLRFFSILLRANSTHWFVNIIYGTTDPLVDPFRGIFPSTAIGPFLAEWSTFVAMIAYALLALVLVRLLDLLASTLSHKQDEEQSHHSAQHHTS